MATWHDLDCELDAWTKAGQRASLWWRDDDAAAPTPALDRLLDLAARVRMPLHLAVIPARLEPDLTRLLQGREEIRILQHGYAHINNAADDERAAELSRDRPAETVRRELATGWRRLQDAALAHTLPVLVPPWNRIAPELTALLPALGYRVLSTFKAREAREPTPGLLQVNTHCDPIRWKDGKRFRGTDSALELLVDHLRSRRTADVDADEPSGFLTHHLQTDEPCWAFIEALLERTVRHRGACWIGLETLIEN